MVTRHQFSGGTPLLAIVAGSEIVQQHERFALAKDLKSHVPFVPGEATGPAPGGALQAPTATSDQGVGDGGDTNRYGAEQEAANQSLLATSSR
jgi:hypothetical protein